MRVHFLRNVGTNPVPIGPLWTDPTTFLSWPLITLGWLGDMIGTIFNGIHFVYTFVTPPTFEPTFESY